MPPKERPWISPRYSTLEEVDIEQFQPAFDRGMYTDGFASWNPQRIAEKQDRKHIVHKSIDQLPPAYREIVILRDQE